MLQGNKKCSSYLEMTMHPKIQKGRQETEDERTQNLWKYLKTILKSLLVANLLLACCSDDSRVIWRIGAGAELPKSVVS